MTTLRRPATLLLLLLAGFGTRDASAAELPRLPLRMLELGNPEERREAVRSLAETEEPEAFELLVGTLDTDDRGYQATVARALIRSFPERSNETFPALLESVEPNLRIVATHALGLLERSDAMAMLLPLLSDSDPQVIRAALSAVSQRMIPLTRVARQRVVSGGEEPLPEERLQELRQLREGLLERVLEQPTTWPTGSVGWLAFQAADESFGEAAVSAWAAERPRGRGRLGRLLTTLRESNESWLGRPALPAPGELRFSFEGRRAGAERPLEGDVRLSSVDVEALRMLRLTPERVAPLPLPADLLVTLPSFGRPELVSLERGIATVAHELPEGMDLTFGIGRSGAALFTAQRATVHRAVLRFHARSGRILEETAFDAEGRELAHWQYEGWTRNLQGGWVPRRVRIELRAGGGEVPSRYEFAFRCSEDSAWLLDEATSKVVVPGGEVEEGRLRVRWRRLQEEEEDASGTRGRDGS